MLKIAYPLLLAGSFLISSASAQTRPPASKGSGALRAVSSSGVRQGQEPAAAAPAGSGADVQMEVRGVRPEPRLPAMSPQAQAERDRILQAWSSGSDGITRLEGQIERIVYDTTFETESRSWGKFAYEKPDKGRIDINPVPITDKVVESRQQEVEKARSEQRRSEVRVGKNGQPYQLTESQREQWWCDGERIYSLDLDRMEAMVNQIPVEMQGGNIMDSPLPFLFGMPPERALRRFEIGFFGGKVDPTAKRVRLVIYPNLPQDAQSWKQADVLLDTSTWLPEAVQLHDPAGTKLTVYSFSKLKKNGSIFELLKLSAGARFTPSLKDFNVLPIDSAAPATVPKLAGLHFQEALQQLEQLGLKRTKDAGNRVLLQEGSPAPGPEQKFHVQSQTPAAGTPLQPGLKVTLRLFADPAKKAAQN
ncbi:MAG: PASTA domain-containing protein [Planctomycetota bacterium]